MIIYGIVPRSIELLALSLIFIRLSHRTKTLLQNVVGAQEQKETLDYIMTITDKSYDVANVLSKSVKELLEATGNAITTNEHITKMTGNIVDGSKQTIRYVEEAGSVVSGIVSDLKLIADDNVKISDVSQETKNLTDSNTINMKNAADGIRQIDDAAKKSKDIILKLGEKSNEIVNIAQIIKSIAESTSLLSLNASIESARAGEHGRGFAVVATEIRVLAEQSQQAAGNIAELIQTVVADTMEAVNAIDYNAKLVEKGLALINKADRSSAEVSDSIQKVNAIATNAATLSSTVAKNGDKINSAVEGISKLTVESMERLKGILQSSEEQLKAVNEVAVFVEAIDTTSDELLSVVNKKL
jgi:methyl-accepting chemotaxis protein